MKKVEKFLHALLHAIETRVNISTMLKKRAMDYSDPNIQYQYTQGCPSFVRRQTTF